MVELSQRTRQVVERLFANERTREEAAWMLAEVCGDTLPLATLSTPEDLERIRFAAPKCSEGDLRKLKEAIELARIDWRDLLMNADFGFDVDAHDRWFAGAMGA